jgi:hypothetical protein
LQGLADGLESLSAAGLGKRLGIAKRSALPERGQGVVGLLSAVQIPALKSAAELLNIGLAVLIKALELLKNR